ncbi:YceI family protein [Bacteroidetes/Chlorobi group bacterium Naka2016]|jgi:polyisoprenoid-binding protein YceI|nr:MAG: YceI family protein [Bacteroidetes/Chlorobi group bacterium Naka2016]
MKNNIKKLIILSLNLIFLATLSSLAQNTYNLDVAKSNIKWIGKKFLGAHWGWVNFKSGNISYDGKKITSGEFEVDMTSIRNEDLKDKDLNAKLVGHLKSDDFFSVAKFPTAKFVITHSTPLKASKAGEPNIAITGKMTIKGITQTISFPATIKADGNKITAKAKLELDRTKFDVRYGSGSFFDNLGDNVIYDNFTLELNLTFSK